MAIALTTALTGCSSGPAPTERTATATATTTATATAAVTPSAPAAAAPATSASASGAAAAPQQAAGPTACTTAHLAGSLSPLGAGMGGQESAQLVLTNTGSVTCTLQGWPGVSFVRGAAGDQVGAAARFLRDSPHTVVTL